MQVARPEWQTDELIQGQLMIADVAVVTKADMATEAQLDAAHRFCDGLYPPKLEVATARGGAAPLALLSISRSAAFQAARPAQHALAQAPSSAGASASEQGGRELRSELAPGRPVRFRAASAAGQQATACGWMFNSGDCFHHQRLLDLLQRLAQHADRVKGIFRVGKGFVALRTGQCGDIELQPVAYRRESRIEVIVQVPGAAGAPPEQVQCASVDNAVCKVADVGDTAHAVESSGCTTALSERDVAGRMHDALVARDWDVIEKALVECLVPAAA